LAIGDVALARATLRRASYFLDPEATGARWLRRLEEGRPQNRFIAIFPGKAILDNSDEKKAHPGHHEEALPTKRANADEPINFTKKWEKEGDSAAEKSRLAESNECGE
jgi:hypothetical protein